jgi:hypothetical protein
VAIFRFGGTFYGIKSYGSLMFSTISTAATSPGHRTTPETDLALRPAFKSCPGSG